MIQHIKDSATAVGILAVITNSAEKIETQLNTLTTRSEQPIMLVTWDIVSDLEFDGNGFLKNPQSNITALLVHKPNNLKKDVQEAKAESMGDLFQVFLQDLYTRLLPLQTTSEPPITGANYQRVPNYGLGKHAGILAKWRMATGISNCS